MSCLPRPFLSQILDVVMGKSSLLLLHLSPIVCSTGGDCSCPFASLLTSAYFSFLISHTDGQNALLDTAPLRQAVWYYVQRLAGLLHDDYDYADVNRYLTRRLKMYIKKCACYPEELDSRDFSRFGFTLRNEEKVHINLLVAEARRQAELVYALHTISVFAHTGGRDM